MKEGNIECSVIENKEIADNIYKITLRGDISGYPGQFYMVRAWNGLDPFLSRPLSISDIQGEHISFVYELRGKGTKELSLIKTDETIQLTGPLGNGFTVNEDLKSAVVSGGVGIAPMIYLLKKYHKRMDMFAGFRAEPYLIDECFAHSNNLHVASEEGLGWHKGLVTELINVDDYDVIYACGPEPMLKALAEMIKNKTILYISMENHMACGIGSCLGCTIQTRHGIKRVCKDGPVFEANEVYYYE